mmetsp:Transcript_25132/g.62038  ORF Transcript_25132/g.62038 Transcript_25132/m.62038 type:complete len:147 (-) Transcript_25132:1418-1858(-)
MKVEKKSKKDKKEKKEKKSKKSSKDSKRSKEEKMDPVTARLKKTMMEALYPEKMGIHVLSDEDKMRLAMEKNKGNLYERVSVSSTADSKTKKMKLLQDRTGQFSKDSSVMKGGKGPMSANETRAYDLHMDQMNGGHGGAFRKNCAY